jgi:uridine kinase
MKSPFVVGVAGGTGSGKTTVVQRLTSALGAERVALLEQDAYYRDGGHLSPAERAARNYDHPDAIDEPLLAEHLRQLVAGEAVEVPCYDFVQHRRLTETRRVEPCACILVEGILVLASEALREQMDLRLYVETDADVRFIRRLRRDIDERGRSPESVIQQWEATVRPMHLQFVEPTKRHADLIIPEGGFNGVALDVLLTHLTRVTRP